MNARAFEPLLAAQVGHSIIARSVILAALSVFCLALAAMGAWLAARSDLSHLGWAGPTAAVLVALVIIAMGFRVRHIVPPTTAVEQFVEVIPNASEATITGLLGLYSPEPMSVPLGAEQGGIFLPDRSDADVASHRMVWTDTDSWHWENTSLTPGLHLAPYATSTRLNEPVSAHLTFAPGGAIGKVALGPLRELADPVLALPSRRNLSVHFTDADGTFLSAPEDQLARGQFLAAGLLSQEQQRRQALLGELLNRRNGPRYPMQPLLLAWSSPLDLGFKLLDAGRHTGSALVAIPLAIDRPADGAQVVVPAAFISYQCVAGPGLNLCYDPRQNEWISLRKKGGRMLLRFQVPIELLPLRIERASVVVDLLAQARSFQVLSGKRDVAEVLQTWQSPVGRLQFDIERPDLLQPDSVGSIYLGLEVGEAEKLPGEEKPSSEWKINDLQLELTGKIQKDRDGHGE